MEDRGSRLDHHVVKASVRPYGAITYKGSPIKLRAEVILQGKGQWPFWAQFWSEWKWNEFIRPCIDAAAANGANALQINGDGLADGGFFYPDDEVFRARVVQICNYAALKGMVILWQLGYRPNVTFAGDPAQRALNVASAAKVAGWLQQISNVVTIDVMNEWDAFAAPHWGPDPAGVALGDMVNYIREVRKVFFRPLCASVTDYRPFYHGPIAPYVDYHNYHNYDWQRTDSGAAYVPKASDIASFKAQPWYKGAFIIGETGIPLGAVAPDGQTITTAMRRGFMTGMKTQADDPDCLGCFHWGLYNTTGQAHLRVGNWGSVDESFQPYPEMAEPIAAWPGRL